MRANQFMMRLRQFRQQSGLSQRGLASKIDIASNKIGTSLHKLTRGLQDSTGRVSSFFKNHRDLSKAAISMVMVVGIVAGLWAASPAQALNITFPSLPDGTLGATHTFTVKIDVQDIDLLPITKVDLDIAHTTFPNQVNLTDLPLATASRDYTTAGGTVNVSAVTGAGWGYASASRYGYGYGYDTGSWGYQYGTGFGYGYGYGYGRIADQIYPYGYGYGYGYASYMGTTDITYTVTWTPPTAWPQGTYEVLVRVHVNGGDTILTASTPPTFILSSDIPPYSPPAPLPKVLPGTYTMSGVTITIGEGVTGLTEEGEPLSEISIVEMEEVDVPSPPEDGYVIGVAYDIGPDGATFDPPITMTFTYDSDDLPDGVNEEDLAVGFWDEDPGEWVKLPSVVNTADNIITATVSHFTAFAIIYWDEDADEGVKLPSVVEEEEEEVVTPVVTPPVEEEEEVVTPVVAPPVEEEEEEEVVTPVVTPPVEEEEVVTPAAEAGLPWWDWGQARGTPGLAWWLWVIFGVGVATVIGLLGYFFWYKPRRSS